MTAIDDFPGWSVSALSVALDAGKITSGRLTRAYLERIEKLNPQLNAFIAVLPETALEAAQRADRRIRLGQRLGPLDGIPVAVKDNIDVRGVPTTSGMDCRRSRPARDDAEVVRCLLAAGAVILGKTNMDEAAMGGTTDNPFFGRTQHPLKHGYTPGGSSGGSAVAVAAHLCAAALGTDTLGSIRIPASYCGIVGLKPTFGLVSTRGVCPLCHRLDHVGPMARTVEDAQIMLKAIARYDPDCPDARPISADGERFRARPITSLSIGRIRNLEAVAMDPVVQTAFSRAMDVLESFGCRILGVELAQYDPAVARRSGLLCGEADAANTHAALLSTCPERISGEVRALMEYGRDVPGARLARAHRYLDLAAFEFRKLLRAVDVVVAPTTPQPSFPFDQSTPATQGDMTALANISGCPALTIPMGKNGAGLPVGLQIIGRQFEEELLFAIGNAFIGTTDFVGENPDG